MVSRCGKSFYSGVPNAFAKISGQIIVLSDRQEAEEMDSTKGIG